MKNVAIGCDRSRDELRVKLTDNPAEVFLSIHDDTSSCSVLLTDRAKVAELRNALSQWLGSNGPADPSQSETLARWWGLSYASWLTMPRVLMQAMPAEWQERAGVLLAEYNAAFPNMPNYGTTVRATEPGGKLVAMPQWLNNYRYPNRAEIDKCRGVE